MARILRVATLLALACAVAAPAEAQTSTRDRVRPPTVAPPDVSRALGRDGSALEERKKRILEQLYGNPSAATTDPRSRLNLPAHPSAVHKPDAPGGAAAVPGSDPNIGRYTRLDSDRDGVISSDEYMTGRSRSFGIPSASIGSRSAKRQQVYEDRLRSRFRAADRDRDGAISRNELKGLKNPRF